MQNYFNSKHNIPGTAPGIEHSEISDFRRGTGEVQVSCTDYSPGQDSFEEIHDIEDFLGRHRPEGTHVRWIRVVGLSDMNIMHSLATKYDLHPLAIEDILQKMQRPKVESYGGEESELMARLFIVTHALQIRDNQVHYEQVSLFLGHKTVITFEEDHCKEWDPIRQRIQSKGSRLRGNDASFLAYSLLDAIVDNCFPILEYYSERAENLETKILEKSNPVLINEIHQHKRDLLKLHGIIWPMREVVSSLQRESHECISQTTQVYLRDLYDHVVQIIELVETHREIASDLTETYISSVSNRMNEVMKVLTLIGTIFIPLTFLAGVYGMNFRHFPELDKPWAYPAFWAVSVVIALAMITMFHRRKWI